ncbi:hypothetical protein [Pseudoroseicyclus aestuarii]|uniref:Uncharacterized protein n=1 Tax=Pseudoroseicyclus aestuarii TaxID=1795041 RepID=A0A318TCG0_9RHOB|nr:hypothetical protein [Pseudoroseicyclus aestuarii]PYE85998.1 hypothetical protein DFP88_101673 [Pseudoroseicyclus aestuarii]
MKTLISGGLTALLLLTTAPALQAQATPEEGFASENAVLDTSIPFAIGAREARQELRGAFGWPTFQEGMVEGVYFRFDPDGYARFAPTPRLDTDIFEAICRPRTLSCMGRKDIMTLFLNARGQFELRLDEVMQGDTFYLAEGVSEIQLPEQILMPLTPQLETLLSSGGELVVRRDGEEKARVSLVGFSAMSAYLRWVAARQDYTVLPRGWPVPNAVGLAEGGRLTQPQEWASPMPQPQAQPVMPMAAQGSTEVAEVRGELNVLRQMLLQRSGAGVAATADLPQPGPQDATHQRQLEVARMNEIGVPEEPPAAALIAEAESDAEAEAGAEEMPGDRIARHIAYLINEIGLDPQTAVMLLQMNEETDSPLGTEEGGGSSVLALLDELGISASDLADQSTDPTVEAAIESSAPAQLTRAEFSLLTEYFGLVFTELLASQQAALVQP